MLRRSLPFQPTLLAMPEPCPPAHQPDTPAVSLPQLTLSVRLRDYADCRKPLYKCARASPTAPRTARCACVHAHTHARALTGHFWGFRSSWPLCPSGCWTVEKKAARLRRLPQASLQVCKAFNRLNVDTTGVGARMHHQRCHRSQLRRRGLSRRGTAAACVLACMCSRIMS